MSVTRAGPVKRRTALEVSKRGACAAATVGPVVEKPAQLSAEVDLLVLGSRA
jgi:hypothetical protein